MHTNDFSQFIFDAIINIIKTTTLWVLSLRMSKMGIELQKQAAYLRRLLALKSKCKFHFEKFKEHLITENGINLTFIYNEIQYYSERGLKIAPSIPFDLSSFNIYNSIEKRERNIKDELRDYSFECLIRAMVKIEENLTMIECLKRIDENLRILDSIHSSIKKAYKKTADKLQFYSKFVQFLFLIVINFFFKGH